MNYLTTATILVTLGVLPIYDSEIWVPCVAILMAIIMCFTYGSAHKGWKEAEAVIAGLVMFYLGITLPRVEPLSLTVHPVVAGAIAIAILVTADHVIYKYSKVETFSELNWGYQAMMGLAAALAAVYAFLAGALAQTLQTGVVV